MPVVGICVICNAVTVISPEAKKCGECTRKLHNSRRRKRYEEDPEYREQRSAEARNRARRKSKEKIQRDLMDIGIKCYQVLKREEKNEANL